MLKLIFKDLKVSRNSYIMYGVLFFIIFEIYSLFHLTSFQEVTRSGESSMVIMAYFLLFIIIQFNTFYMDSKNDSLHFIGAFPIKRYNIIKSKYMFMIGVLISPVVLYIINVIVQKTITADMDVYLLKSNFLLMIFSVCIMLVFSAFDMPIFYLFNYKRAGVICSVLTYIIMFFSLFIYGFSKNISIIEAIDKLNTVSTVLTIKSIILIIILSLSLYIVSMITSIKIFERKDM